GEDADAEAQRSSVRELAARQKLDGILHADHAEVAATAGNAVVDRIPNELLRLAGQRCGERRWDGEVVVLLGAEPAEAVGQVRAAPGDVGAVGAAAVDGAAEVD